MGNLNRNGSNRLIYGMCAVVLYLILLNPATLNAASPSSTSLLANVHTAASGFWCSTLSFVTVPLGFCVEEGETVVVSTPAEPQAPPEPTETKVAPPPTATPQPPVTSQFSATTTPDNILKKPAYVTNEYITNEYITNPTTIIREVVKETVRDRGGNSSSLDTSDFVPKDLFYSQVDVLYDSSGESINNLSNSLSEAVATNLLTVTGNGTISGTLSVTGAFSAATSTLTSLTVADSTTLSGSLTLAALSDGILTTDANGLVSTTSISASSVVDDTLDFSQFVDDFTLDTTATFDLDTNNADWNMDNGTFFVDSSAGNVGIGTTAPDAPLTINGDISLATTTSNIHFRSNGFGAYINSNGYDINNYLRQTGRQFEIGVKGTSQAFEFIPEDTETWRMRYSDSSNSSADLIIGSTVGAQDALAIKGDTGNVGIGTTNPSLFKLQVAGNVGPNADNTYTLGAVGSDWECVYYEGGSLGTCASDERLKENISALSFDTSDASALQKVAGLTLHTFNFKEAPDSPYNGLIAQEVLEVAPELVTEGSNGFLAVKYGDIQWLILEAVQELWSTVKGFAEHFTSKRIVAQEELVTDGQLCIGSTCVNEADLKAFLEESGRNSNPSAPAETSDEDDAPEDESNDEGNDQTNSEDDSTDTATTTATTTSPQVDDTASSSPSTDEAVADESEDDMIADDSEADTTEPESDDAIPAEENIEEDPVEDTEPVEEIQTDPELEPEPETDVAPEETLAE